MIRDKIDIVYKEDLIVDISYELYKVFYHVAITLSSSEASKQLSTSQSAVDQPIKVLEKKLNQPLFIRNTKKIWLTPRGEILLKHIGPTMNLIKQGEDQLLEAHIPNDGQLRIGVSDTVCRYYLVPYLNRSHKKFPNIHIKVTNQTPIKRVRFLENGQADFVVTNYPSPVLTGNMHTRVINELHDVFVASRSASPLKDKRLILEELPDCPITILDQKSTISEFPHQVFQESQLDLVPGIEFSSSDLLIDLARIGLGITLVPDFCIPAQDENLSILDLKEQLPSRQMMVAYSESLPVSQATRQFMDILQQSTLGPPGPRMRLPPTPYYSG